MEYASAISSAISSATGEAILPKFVGRMLKKLSSMVELTEYVSDDKIFKDIKELKEQLNDIYCELDDAVEKQWDNNQRVERYQQVERFVSDLRDLAYDLQDVLDDLATEAQRRKPEAVATTHARPSKMRKVLSAFQFSPDMVSKVKSIRARFDKVFEVSKGFHFGEPNRRRERPSTRESSSVLEMGEAKIYGRDDDREGLLERLKATHQRGSENVSVIPIIGMGGIGKTTLAQLLFKILDTPRDFDFKAWASVGEDFNVLKITKAILPGSDDGKMDLNHLQTKLKEKLHQKKCFIVLDDVWNEDYDKWTLFCGPLQGCAPGSKILVTTRDQSVSDMMGTMPAYALKELSQEDCLSVFAQHALGGVHFENHLHLKDIGQRIVTKCGGLPLAAKAIGGMLKGKVDPGKWEKVLNSKIWEVPKEYNILPALRLSYFHLQFHLKQCFAYCAIFPKDFEFNKMELVLLWMAEGFVDDQFPEKMIDLGCQYFDDLLSRSFFQVSRSYKSRYVMHDLIHDLAQSVSGETCFHLGDNQKNTALHAKIRHLSFNSNGWDDTWQRFKGFSETKNLRTFLALPIMGFNRYTSNKFQHDKVPKLRSLRVLSLVGFKIEELPSSISELKRLRYLNLSYTLIERLPETVCDLLHLQTLRLRGCYKLTELPIKIGNLIKLQCLDICGCTKLTKLPSGISNLTKLQCLDVTDRTSQLQQISPRIRNLRNLVDRMQFTVGKDNGVKLTELKKFSKLQGKLIIEGLQNVVDVQDAEIADLKEKHGIEELELAWGNSSRNPGDEEVGVLNSLKPHQNLAILSIKGFGGIEFPSWIVVPAFNKMVKLSLCGCRNIRRLPPLGKIPSLRELNIKAMGSVKEVGAELYGDGSSCFTTFERLSFVDMEQWEQWSWISGAVKFPKLGNLQISDCPRLVEKLPSCLPCLEKLYIRRCQGALLRGMSDFTSLTHLVIKGISGLKSLDESHIEDLVALHDLDISECDGLLYLWKDGTNLEKLVSLERLNISICDHLVSLVEGEEGKLPCNLQYLKISCCRNLNKLGNGLHLSSLGALYISNCDGLESLPSDLSSLQSLDISNCDSLVSLPSDLSSLRSLDISNCHRLESLLSDLSSLQSLDIRMSEWGLHRITSLTKLTMEGAFPSIVSFPDKDLLLPSSLTSIHINGFENLKFISRAILNLTSLKNLSFYECPNLQSFPEEGLPPTLEWLHIWGCPLLKEWCSKHGSTIFHIKSVDVW